MFKNLTLIAGLTILLIISLFQNYYNSHLAFIAFVSIMFFLTFYLLFKEIEVFRKFYFEYYFYAKRNPSFNKKIERPRLFTYLVFGTSSLIFIYKYINMNSCFFINCSITRALIFICFSFCIIMMNYTWGSDFENKFSTSNIKQKSKLKNKDFKLSWQNDDLIKICKNLMRYDFIEIIDTKTVDNPFDIFSKELQNGKIPEKQIFKLNMDNVEFKYFYDSLSKNSEKFTLDVFLNFFINKNEGATRGSIESSASKNVSGPKRRESIDACFIIK